jgi:hypothetical protein
MWLPRNIKSMEIYLQEALKGGKAHLREEKTGRDIMPYGCVTKCQPINLVIFEIPEMYFIFVQNAPLLIMLL